MANPDKAGRVIAGLLGYNPGPGIYSRLERAVEAMPANVRVEELPGLLKRYKEGVPGWELKEADFPGLVGDAKVIPRQDLLDRVRERSPVFTHREMVYTGAAPPESPAEGQSISQWLQQQSSPLGQGSRHGDPIYGDYSQGGDNYTELLLAQPGQDGTRFGSHWTRRIQGFPAVAHARFDTHGDALRINELQSDLGIHNRKMREQDAEYQRVARELGSRAQAMGFEPGQTLPFPLEDAWSDLLIKRLALEAARKGHRAIEIASPRAIADKVGGNIENYEHFYGKVVPGAIERLGRKMGGVTDVTPLHQELLPGYSALAEQAMDYNEPYAQGLRLLRDIRPPGPRPAFDAGPETAFRMLTDQDTDYGRMEKANLLHGALAVDLQRGGMSAEEASVAAAQHMPALVRMAEDQAEAYERFASLRDLGFVQNGARRQSGAAMPPPRRYLMSDEMRKRILTSGIGASLLAPMAMDGQPE